MKDFVFHDPLLGKKDILADKEVIMKKFKSALPTVCYTFLLLSIALLSFLIAGKASAQPSVAEEPDAPLNEEIRPEQTEDSVEINNRTVYSDEFPRPSDQGIQRIYGEGNVVFKGALHTSVGNFLFLESDCTVGDLTSQSSCLALIKTNENGDLLQRTIIAEKEKFLSAQVTPVGIVVTSSDETSSFDHVRVFNVELRMENEFKIAPPYAERILPTEENFIIFADYGDECLLYRYADTKLLFQEIDRGQLVEFFEYEEEIVLFLTDDSYGSTLLHIDKKTLSTTKKTNLSPSLLLSVWPVWDGKKTYYCTMEKSSEIVVKRYDVNTLSYVETVRLGNLDIEKIYPTNDGILFVAGKKEEYYQVETSESIVVRKIDVNTDEKINTVLRTPEKTVIILSDADNNFFFIGKEKIGNACYVFPYLSGENEITFYQQKKDEYGNDYVEFFKKPIE